MAYARSAKVRFRVVSEGMDQLTKANDDLDKLIDRSKKADDILSQLGKGISTKNLTAAYDKLDKLGDKSSSVAKTYKDNLSAMNDHNKSFADSVRSNTSESSKAFSEMSRNIQDDVKKLPSAKKFKYETNLSSARDDMRKTGTSSTEMSDKVHHSMSNVKRSSEETRTSFSKLSDAGGKISNMAATVSLAMVPVAAAFNKAAGEATKLQNTYTTIKNLMNTSGSSSAVSAATAKKMQAENRKLSNEYGESQTSLASGSETLLRRGYSGSQDLASHKKFLEASRASGDSYNSVVNYGASTLEQFGYKKAAADSTKKMKAYTNKVLNEMAYGADLTATDFSGMGNALRYTGATSHSNNQSLASTIASIGVLSNNGQDGSVAGTGLRKVINSLISPTSGPSGLGVKALKSIGLSPSDLKDSKGNLYSLDKEFEILNSHMKGDSNGQKSTIFHELFGATGQESALILSNNVKQMESLTGQVQKATNYKGKGYIEALSSKNMKSWGNQVKVFKTHLDNLGQSFATYLLPAITKVLSKLNGFLKFIDNLPNPMKKAIAYTTALASAMGSLYVSYKLFSATANMISGKKSSMSGMSGMGSSVSRSSVSSGAKGILSKAASSGLLGGKAGKAVINSKSEAGSRVASSGFKSMSTLGKTATVGVGIGVAATSGLDIYKAFKEKNSTKKFRDYGKGIGTAIGGGVGFYFGGPLGAAVGSTIGNVVGGWAGKAVKKFSKTKMGKKIGKSFNGAAKYVEANMKPVGKALKSAGSSISKSWSSTSKSLKKPMASAFKSIKGSVSDFGKHLKSSFNTDKKYFKTVEPYVKALGKIYVRVFKVELVTAIKVFGHTLSGVIKAAGIVLSGLATAVKGVFKIVSGVFSGIDDLIHGRWKKAWKDAKTIFSGFKDEVKAIIGTISGLMSDVFGTIGKDVKDVIGGLKSVYTNVKDVVTGKSTKKTSSKKTSAHAVGGAVSHTGMSLVGEGGVELEYTKNGRSVQLLGVNGPTFERVTAGSRILNAKDTKKVLSGGLGRGKKLPGYANGTTSLAYASGTTVKSGNSTADVSVKKLAKDSKSQWTRINKDTAKLTTKTKKNTVSDYDDLQKNSYKQLQQFDKGNTTRWKNINSDTSHYTTKTKKNSISDYDDMQKGVQKQMDQLNTGVTNSAKDTASNFGDALYKMKKYSHTAMSGSITELNSGISSIDKVLSQFGGNSSVIKTVHYAKGSNGKLKSDQLGILNDAKSGPRQEAVIRSGKIMVPHGKNTMVPLKKDDQVLNGSQTNELADMLDNSHFASGSGVSHSELRKIAKNYAKNSSKFISSDFTDKLTANSTALNKAITSTSKGASSKYGDAWSSAMWNYINGLIDTTSTGSGTKGKFLAEAIKLGKAANLKYSEDTSLRLGPKAYDCSGLVYTALKKLGITLPGSTTGPEYKATNSVSWDKGEPGDLAFFNGHVGIVSSTAGEGRMWNAENPTDGIKYGPIKDFGGFKGLRTVPGLSSKSAKKKDSSGSSSLQKLVKQQLGSSAVKWIKKNLQESVGSIGSISLGGDVASRAKKLAAAIKKAYPSATDKGIAAVLGNWEFESGLNPSAQNSIGASGLGQWLNGRFTALESYAKKHGTSWKNAGTQLSYALNGDGSDSKILKSILRGKGSLTSLASAFSSEWERGGYTAKHVAGAEKVYAALHNNGGWSQKGKINVFGEKDSEVAINPKKKSADSLISSVASVRSKQSDSIFSSENIKKQLASIAKNNPLTNNIFKKSAKSGSAGSITVNANFNFTINADSTSAGTATAQAIKQAAPQIKSLVQQMMMETISKQEEGTI